MSTEFQLTVRPTSYTIYPGKEACEKMRTLLYLLEFEDEYNETLVQLGYLLDEKTDKLYLHKGVAIDYIRRLLGNLRVKYQKPDPAKEMKFEYDEIVAPRNNEQVDVINFIAGLHQHASNIEENQIFLVKNPGFGKSYCSGVGMCLYHKKALIIMHRDSLRSQWYESLYKMIGLTDNDVHKIESSKELYDIAHGYDPGYDVYLMTHATFRAGLKLIRSFEKASNITKVLGIGMKIIDEAHLEFRDTLIMDYIFNVKRNLYLTATDGRSSKEENRIFKYAFENTKFYKPSSLLTDSLPKKWVEYNVVAINTHAKASTVKYKIEGFRGMSAVSYGKFCIQIDKNHTHFKCCRDILKMVFERDPTSKVLIFLPLIDLCTEATYFFIKSLNYDKDFQYDLNIKTINSHNSKQENEENRRADVIVTTVGSCGTGTDIPGITTIISCTPIVSKVNARQIFGRIRYCGKPCYYYDIYDESVKMDKIWLNVRAKVYSPLATKTNYISWEDDDHENTNT